MFGILGKSFFSLRDELLAHLHREESILFPAIVRFEEAAETASSRPETPFGPLTNPVAVMQREHEGTLRVLQAMRLATKGYAIPEDACTGYRSLFLGLAELEENLHRHIYLENEVLFRRALRL